MAQMRCPHCGAENFTMEGWEDLDHCSSCGKPLADTEEAPPRRSGTEPLTSDPGTPSPTA
jgi:DNA-directed RNA polymerase subunit RPC12/RpoP